VLEIDTQLDGDDKKVEKVKTSQRKSQKGTASRTATHREKGE